MFISFLFTAIGCANSCVMLVEYKCGFNLEKEYIGIWCLANCTNEIPYLKYKYKDFFKAVVELFNL